MRGFHSHAIRERWDRYFDSLHLVAPEGAFLSLLERYDEPHRAYHTLRHIEECFEQFDLVSDVRSPGEAGIALWFHDAIYDPRSSDNEVRSAELARSVLSGVGATSVTIEAVERLILATQHSATPHDHDALVVVDVDLAIFAADASRYQEYGEQIRREYHWVAEIEFRRERVAILRQFLDREFLYNTTSFRRRLEARARTNLAREIASLSTW